MIHDICKDELFLAQKAEFATPDDLQVAADLLETLEHHKDGCVDMAANMIGVRKTILVAQIGATYQILINPVIVDQTGIQKFCRSDQAGKNESIYAVDFTDRLSGT